LGIIGFVLFLDLDAVYDLWAVDPLEGNVSTFRIVAGFGCFLNWIKLFYWMRLFDGLAFYVNLIIKTISGAGLFMFLVAQIIVAFATFFYIVNLNNAGTLAPNAYAPDYTTHGWINAMI